MESKYRIKKAIGDKIMKTMQSFLIFFYILDQSYNQCKKDDIGASCIIKNIGNPKKEG